MSALGMEKKTVTVDEAETSPTPPDDAKGDFVTLRDALQHPDADKTEAERLALDRKVRWKCDLNLIPWLCLVCMPRSVCLHAVRGLY